MNASPLASSRASSESSPPPVATPARRRSLRSLLGTITGICFVFGALVAVQVRSITNLEKSRVAKTQNDAQQKQLAEKYRVAAAKASQERDAANGKLKDALLQLKNGSTLSKTQIAALMGQIKNLQVQACLTPISGPGVRAVLSDNPQAAQAGGNPSLPLPGLVHDYDVLQVVNELRSAKADAIAVHGAGGAPIRITATTPIRCVGPTIYINFQPVAAPFTIEAVGNARALQSAIEMPGGIVENLRVQGAVGVKVSTHNTLTLPPGDAAPGTTSSSAADIATQIAPAGKSKGL